jgi:hypothetical protein
MKKKSLRRRVEVVGAVAAVCALGNCEMAKHAEIIDVLLCVTNTAQSQK